MAVREFKMHRYIKQRCTYDRITFYTYDPETYMYEFTNPICRIFPTIFYVSPL